MGKIDDRIEMLFAAAGAGYGICKDFKKFNTCCGIVKGLTDEDTGSGALSTASIEATKLIAGKALGENPFFDYHKSHFEALANAQAVADPTAFAKRQLDTVDSALQVPDYFL